METSRHEQVPGGGAGVPPGGGDGTPSIPPPPDERPTVSIECEMRSAYLDYAMSVIIGRAIPDVRDGLKPVHRRILFAMHELKNFFNQPYKKSARVVGDVIGKYHPHGEAAVYDALVRMAQDFSMRHVLVDGQGNFGSVDGDPPAAMRYTEVRMHRLAGELLGDLEKDTVDWGANYDDSLREPLVMPARFPNLLVNGANGIAVGMATSIPPHNLAEVVTATIMLVRDPDLPDDELLAAVPGPDFPTGGVICGSAGARQAALTGRGILTVRGRAHVEDHPKTGRSSIVVTEIPFQVNKARLVERIADLIREKRIQGISDLRDESDRDGIRVVAELRREAVPQVVLNQIFKLTPLQDTFGTINLAIVDGRPQVLPLRGLLLHFVQHRRVVVTRRCRFELGEAEAREHVLEGLARAIDRIDEVIAVIRAAGSPAEAKGRLVEAFDLSEIQAQAILDMRLQRLTALERGKILAELAEVRADIARLRAVLADEKLLDDVVVRELEAVRERYGEERRTEIVADAADIDIEDLIQRQDMVVTISHQGFIKRNPARQYRAQRRGGRGVSGMEVRDEDFVRDLFVASTHSHVLFFSDRGKVYVKKVFEIPEAGKTAKGRAIVNFVGMEPDEKVAAVLPVPEFVDGRFVVTATRRGHVKKTSLMEYSAIRQKGIIGLLVDPDDSLVGATLTGGDGTILLGTRDGMTIRFPEEQVRPMGRATRGVRGIALEETDAVVSMSALAGEEGSILTVCGNGFGKRTDVAEYRPQNRGGKGLIDIKTTDRNGPVIAQLHVRETDHIMLVTDDGTVLRSRVHEVSMIGRNTQGVRLIRLEETRRLVAAERWAEAEDDDAEAGTAAARNDPGDGATAEEPAGPDRPSGGEEETS